MSQQLALTKRNPSIDYVKVWASFSVISIHFRLNVQEIIPIETFGKWTSLFFSVIYQIFIPCVPLFLIATGYLMHRKTYSLKYYITIFTSVALKNKQTEFLDKNKKSFTMVGKMTYPRPL